MTFDILNLNQTTTLYRNAKTLIKPTLLFCGYRTTRDVEEGTKRKKGRTRIERIRFKRQRQAAKEGVGEAQCAEHGAGRSVR
jgi:hypothetical protein